MGAWGSCLLLSQARVSGASSKAGRQPGWMEESEAMAAQGAAVVSLLEVWEEAYLPEPCFPLSSAFQERRQCPLVDLPVGPRERKAPLPLCFLAKGTN